MSGVVSILHITDISAIADGFEEKLLLLNKENKIHDSNYEKYIFDTTKDLKMQVNKIAELFEKNKFTHIISDRDFAEIETDPNGSTKEGNYKRVDEFILNVFEILEVKYLIRLKSLIIYAYDPVSLSLRKDFRELRDLINDNISEKLKRGKTKLVKTVETSAIFRRPYKTGLYPYGFNYTTAFVGSIQTCKFYGELLADFFTEMLSYDESLEKLSNPLLYDKLQNYELSKFIRSLDGTHQSNGFAVGSVSCRGKVFKNEEYFTFTPFRPVKQVIKNRFNEADFRKLFHMQSDLNAELIEKQSLYFKYEVYSVYSRDDNDWHDAVYIIDKKIYDSSNGPDNYEQWLPLLHSSIFYCRGNKCIYLDSQPEGAKLISTFSIFFAISAIKEENFNGSFNFTLFKEFSPEKENTIDLDTLEIQAFEKYFHIIKSKFVSQILPYTASEIKKQTIRAAISQVMSRNMSHNLGSHVLAKLASVEEINNITKQIKQDIAFAELNSYLRTRMDFLADLSTGTPVLVGTKNLYADVIYPIKKQNALLKKHITGNKKEFDIFFNNKKLNIAFPNDSLGVQAFYILLENFIRNSAKHGKGNKLNVCLVETEDFNEDFVGFIIYDLNDRINEINEIEKLSEKSKNPKKKEAEEILNNLIENQQKRIDLKVLDNGLLRPGSWGMLEMKVAAAYLRKLPIENIDNKPDDAIPLLSALKQIDTKGFGHLAYKFYMLKPKNVLVVLKDQKSIDQTEEIAIKRNDLLRFGVQFVTSQDIELNKISFNHELVLLADNDYLAETEDLKSSDNFAIKEQEKKDLEVRKRRFSERIISCNNNDLKQKLKDNDAKEFIEWVWSLWYRKLELNTKDVSPIEIKFFDDNEPAQEKALIPDDRGSKIRAYMVCHPNIFFVNHPDIFSVENTDYFEKYGGSHPAYRFFENQFKTEGKDDDWSFETKCRIVEMINYSVAVVDERIQGYSNIDYDGLIKDKKMNDFFLKCKITVPDHNIDLNKEDYDSSTIASLKLWILNRSYDHKFLIIHLGIIEKFLELQNKTDDVKKEEIKKYLEGLENNVGRKAIIIITSGRGQPQTLPEGERFIHYSNITQYITEKKSKFHLIQLLMSARELIKSSNYG